MIADGTEKLMKGEKTDNNPKNKKAISITINIKMPEPNKFIDWVTEKDLSKMHFISIDDKEAINLTEVLHIKACKIKI